MRAIKTNLTSVLIFALAFCFVQSGRAQEDAKQKDLPNFYRISDVFYRGGQPSEDGLKLLTQLHIKTIVNLRDDDSRARAEAVAAQAAGLRYFNLPLASFDKPADARVAEILSIINAPENQPVFVHCKRGSDRTGTIVAIYRIEFDGWTGKQAKEEAKRFGLGFWQVRMKDYIGDYYHQKLARSQSRIPKQKLR